MTPQQFSYLLDRSGLSLDAVSKAFGVTVRTLYNWKTGKTPILPVAIEGIKKVLQCRK